MSPSPRFNPKAISPPPLKRRRLSPSPKPLLPIPPPAPPPSRPIRPLDPTHFRIFAWNINGIAPFLQPSIKAFFSPRTKPPQPQPPPRPSTSQPPHPPSASPASLPTCLARWHHPHLLCLQEVHISPTDTATQRAVQKTVESNDPRTGYTAHFSLPRDRYNARGLRGQRKVHGVCTLVRNDIHARCATAAPEWDLEGRVLVSRLPDLNLVVINVYAPNGTALPYYSPVTGMESGTRHDFKRAFHTSLAALVGGCQEEADAKLTVVVVGDMNVARHAVDGFPNQRQGAEHVRSRRDFEEKFMEGGLGMRDGFREVWGSERKFSYRPRNVGWGESGDRVDLTLVSKDGGEGMIEDGAAGSRGSRRARLIEADILDDEGERGPSDHVPIYVTLDI